MAASVNDIYKLVYELNGSVKSLSGEMKALNQKVDDLKADMSASEEASATSRANVHKRLDDIVTRTGHLETDVTVMKETLDKVEGVSDGVVAMRQQATGAGTLGRWLISLGLGIVWLASVLTGAYTYLTGRPPP